MQQKTQGPYLLARLVMAGFLLLCFLRYETESAPHTNTVWSALWTTRAGWVGVVLTIDMNCTESKEIAAVAIAYGLARCVSSTDCRQSVDGNSIRSALCDSIAAEACGRALFKVFDNYMNSPIAPRMKLQ